MDSSDGSEAAHGQATTYEALDGTVYWTLSFYIPCSRLSPAPPTKRAADMPPLNKAFKPAEVAAGLQAGESAVTRIVRDAIDPLFNDIADRTRQGEVLDGLLVSGERETIIFHLPDELGWKTEGRRFRVSIPESDQQRPAEIRRFWYLHSNGALSWHISFAIRYRDQLDTELEGGRITTLYFLSLLQKLAWPKECDASGLTALSTDALLNVRLGAPGSAEEARLPFWQQVSKWCKADRAVAARVHPRAATMDFADFCPTTPSIEMPGLMACETRSLFFLQDNAFFELIQPKRSDGVLVPRRERVLDDVFKAYPTLVRESHLVKDGVYVLDEFFWRDRLTDDTDVVAPPHEDGRLPLPDAKERLFYLFLAGFNQNIIDWANQEASEVLDSLDPIYPASDEQLEEGFFIRYANPRSLITYVKRSRTLEVGNDHILTCPYAFLIHVLAMNNEYLTREKEKRIFDVIDWVGRQLSPEAIEAGRVPTITGSYAEVEQEINRLRIDSFEHFDRHRYANPFRYDTERDVFDKLEKLRGTSRLEFAYKEALSALEEQVKDLERMRAEDERKAEALRAEHDRKAERDADSEQQKRDRRLGALFGLIGLSGAGQLLFNIRDYVEKRFPAFLDRCEVTLDWLVAGIVLTIFAGLVYFLLFPLIERGIRLVTATRAMSRQQSSAAEHNPKNMDEKLTRNP